MPYSKAEIDLIKFTPRDRDFLNYAANNLRKPVLGYFEKLAEDEKGNLALYHLGIKGAHFDLEIAKEADGFTSLRWPITLDTEKYRTLLVTFANLSELNLILGNPKQSTPSTMKELIDNGTFTVNPGNMPLPFPFRDLYRKERRAEIEGQAINSYDQEYEFIPTSGKARRFKLGFAKTDPYHNLLHCWISLDNRRAWTPQLLAWTVRHHIQKPQPTNILAQAMAGKINELVKLELISEATP